MTDRSSLSKKDYTDYEFILNELERFAQFGPGDLKKHYAAHPEDKLHFLPRAGGGTLPFSRGGNERFLQIVERGLAAMSGEGKKHDPKRLFEGIQCEFLRRLQESQEINDDNAHDIFDTVAKELAKRHRALDHFVPCSVVSQRVPPMFSIGPVIFVLTSDFLRQHEGAFDAEDAFGISKLKEFFSEFRWVASVKVTEAAGQVSALRARAVIQDALNLFKLFVGSDRAGGVRLGYAHGGPDFAAMLTRESTHFDISWTRRMSDAVVMDDWHSFLSQQDGWKIAEDIIGSHLRNWADLPEFEQRFIDALTWHGEAVSEPESRGRLLKFWAAIERVVSTRSADAVTRKAALLHARGPQEFQAKFSKCQRLYSIRSVIAHGGQVPNGNHLRTAAFETELVSRDVILVYLYIFQRLTAQGQTTRKQLEGEFQRIDATMKHWLKMLPQPSGP